MADWFVYQPDGVHLGPFSTEIIAAAIMSARLSRQVWLGAPGGHRWLRALDVPVIASMLASYPIDPSRSKLRILPGLPSAENAPPPFHSTVMMVTDDEISLAFEEATMMVTDDEISVAIAEPEAPPPGVPTQRGLPASPSSEPPSR